MAKPKEGHAVVDVIAAFQEGHCTKLTTEDRKHVVGYLKLARPTMTQVQVARLLGVSVETIRKDWAALDTEMAESMQAIDVAILLAQLNAQANVAVEKIHRSLEAMEATEKGKTTATYLQFAKAPFEIVQSVIKTLKDVGLIGEDGQGAQEEYSWRTVTSANGVVTSEATHKINKAIEIAKSRTMAFAPGVHKAPDQIEGEVATENTESHSDTSIN